MVMVENYVGKTLYKLELLLIKFIPYIIALVYTINTILSYFNIDVYFLSHLGGMSILTFIFLYVSSFTFRFCIYHRLPLYYILICDIINCYDYYMGISLDDKPLFILHIIMFSIFLLMLVYLKFKQHEQRISRKSRRNVNPNR